jgi:transcriptional regulator CtsR
MLKRILIGVCAVAMAFAVVPLASAQGPDGQSEREPRPLGELVFRQVLRATAEETGTQPRQILRARAGGQSLNEYIAEHGGEADNVVDSVLTRLDERLSQAVENDRISEEQKNDMLEKVEARLDVVMTSIKPNDFPLNDRERNIIAVLVGRATIQQTADVTDTEPQQVRQALAAGHTLNEYIAEHSGDPNTVVQNVMAMVEEQLANQVKNGRISQEFMDKVMVTLEQSIRDGMSNTMSLDNSRRYRPNRDRPERGGPFYVDVLGIIRQATGLTEADIRPQLRNGLTLERIITEAGADFEVVKAEIIAAFTARADEALANGVITQERYDQFLSHIEERISQFLTMPRERSAPGIDNSNGQNEGVVQ